MATPQTVVNVFPPPGISGEFCSENPRSSLLAGVNALLAGTSGLNCGVFAWATEQGVANNFRTLPTDRLGFVSIYQPVINTAFLQAYGLLVPAGYEVTLHDGGDFWCYFANGAVVGNKVFAAFSNGAASSAAAGAVIAGGSGTGVIAANSTCTFTGVIAPAPFPDTGEMVLTASAVTGTIVAGAALTGTGVATGQTIVSQLTGTPGGAGTYLVSQPSSTASTTITAAYGVLTISGSPTGTFAVGQPLAGTGVVTSPPTLITQLGTGTGGTGTYYVNNNTAVSSTTITSASAQETKWYVNTAAAPGEVAMISTHSGV